MEVLGGGNGSRRKFSSNSFIFLLWAFGVDYVSLSLGFWFDDISWKSSIEDSSSMVLEFVTLDLEQQNRVTQDVSLLNCFENVLTNEIV